LRKWRSITKSMTEFKIVEIVGRRMRDGKEECQVQWAVTWEPVDADFRKGELYREFMADFEKEEKEKKKDADEGRSASREEKEGDAKNVDKVKSSSSEEEEEDAEDAQELKETKTDNQGVNFCPQFLIDRWATKVDGVGTKRPGGEAQRRPRSKDTK
jgi:hypothetical protein